MTGSLPRFRYVLLTDALIDRLDDYEVAAVFGHEIGHIAHRHLLYFGFFFLGSLGVLALLGESDRRPLLALSTRRWAARLIRSWRRCRSRRRRSCSAVGLYFLVVFGHVSRRFERQADVFGCRAVSCGQADCPPHARPRRHAGPGTPRRTLCPVGIRIFANALANVATLNGMEPEARSWRHGSIARRIAFLEGLEGQPEAETPVPDRGLAGSACVALGSICGRRGRAGDRSAGSLPGPKRGVRGSAIGLNASARGRYRT